MIVEDDIPVLRDDVRALSILGINLTWIPAPCLSDTETQPFWLPYVLQVSSISALLVLSKFSLADSTLEMCCSIINSRTIM